MCQRTTLTWVTFWRQHRHVFQALFRGIGCWMTENRASVKMLRSLSRRNHTFSSQIRVLAGLDTGKSDKLFDCISMVSLWMMQQQTTHPAWESRAYSNWQNTSHSFIPENFPFMFISKSGSLTSAWWNFLKSTNALRNISLSLVRRSCASVIPVSTCSIKSSICDQPNGFLRKQRSLCLQYIQLMESVVRGYFMGLRECEYQFASQRWNCLGYNLTIRNPPSRRKPGKVLRSSHLDGQAKRKRVRTYMDRLLSSGMLAFLRLIFYPFHYFSNPYYCLLNGPL